MKRGNGSIVYYVFDIENVGEVKIIEIILNNNDVLFEIYWCYGEWFWVGGDYFVVVVLDFIFCRIFENGEEICEYDFYIVFIDVFLILIVGKYYMGIVIF